MWGEILKSYGALGVGVVFAALTGLVVAFFVGLYFAGDKLIKLIRAVRGKNGETVQPSEEQGEQEEEHDVTERDIGRLEGRLDALASGHRALREDLNGLIGRVGQLPSETAKLCIEELLDRGFIQEKAAK